MDSATASSMSAILVADLRIEDLQAIIHRAARRALDERAVALLPLMNLKDVAEYLSVTPETLRGYVVTET
jgi:hypothetical protein